MIHENDRQDLMSNQIAGMIAEAEVDRQIQKAGIANEVLAT